MKVQLQADCLRVRLDEAGLAELLAGRPLRLRTESAAGTLFALRLELAPTLALEPGDGWRLALPSDAVRAYADTLPRRDALSFVLVGGASSLRVDFEVDARDSRKVRGPPPR